MWKVYKLLNLAEFDVLGVPDYDFTRTLEKRGATAFRLCKGRHYSLVVNGEYLPVGLNGRNPFTRNGYGAHIDAENNLWVGFFDESANG